MKKIVQWNVQTSSVFSVPPPLDSIPLLLYLIRTLVAKLVKQIKAKLKGLCRFPVCAYAVVTSPLDEIMLLPIVSPTVKYAVDFLFLCFLYDHWVWFWRWLTSDWRGIIIENRHMENSVVQHDTPQVDIVRHLIDELTYLIQSCVFVIQLLWSPGWFPVPSREGYFASNRKFHLCSTRIHRWSLLSRCWYLPAEFGESRPPLPSMSLAAPVIWNWGLWEAESLL